MRLSDYYDFNNVETFLFFQILLFQKKALKMFFFFLQAVFWPPHVQIIKYFIWIDGLIKIMLLFLFCTF